MPTTPPRRATEAVLLAALFAAAHTQAPVPYSNQNQYLLHGYAAAGVGHLDRDWLANTCDPTPLFSALVAAGHAAAGEWAMQAAYFLLLMGYYLAARGVVVGVPGFPDTRAARLAFAALFTAAHAAVFRLASARLTGTDYPWFFQCGVAGQYLLGPGIQPSAFGVLLMAGLAAVANGRPVLAGFLAGAAGLMHATYLLPGALFTLGVMAPLAAAGRWRAAVAVGAAALAAALPAVGYGLWAFAPSSPEAFADAQRILAEVRIPHHAVVGRWLDGIAWAQLAWVAVGLVAARRTPVFPVLAALAVGGAVLSAVQVATGSHALALLFPWRVTALLVPAATLLVFARLVSVGFATTTPGTRGPGLWPVRHSHRPEAGATEPKSLRCRRGVEAIAAVALLAMAAGGVWVMAAGEGYRVTADEDELLAWVAADTGPDDVYLLPVRAPAVGTGRGVVSASFLPPPRPKPGSNLIPVDLQRFRLLAGAPVYVDFKSVPYRDADVREWLRRLRQTEAWYDRPVWGPGVREELLREGVTRVVAAHGREPAGEFLDPVYRDAAYTVYRVR